MTDSDLQILTDFRSEVAEPDEATAKRIYALATAPTTRRHRGLGRLRRARRSRLVLVLAAAVLVVIPTALAFRGKIVDLFEGSPPPPAVSTAYAISNKVAGEAIREGVAAKFPEADLSKLHGVIEIQTADGQEDLWAAPNDQGGQCWFVDFANDPASASGQFGHGTCDTSEPPASNIEFEGGYWTYLHPALTTVDGRVYVDASSVQLTLANGSTVTAPVVEGFYLVSLGKSDQVTQVTAYNPAGSSVAEWTRP